MNKRTILVGLLLALTVALTSVGYADAIRGTGTLRAWGDGLAGLRGEGHVEVTGSGALFFRDHYGDAEWTISGEGQRFDLRHGWIAWYGFEGHFEATGSRISVALVGTGITLEAEGTGVAVLQGEGEYEVNGRLHPWTAEFEPIRLEP